MEGKTQLSCLLTIFIYFSWRIKNEKRQSPWTVCSHLVTLNLLMLLYFLHGACNSPKRSSSRICLVGSSPCPTPRRMEAAEREAASVLLTTGITSAYNSTWTMKGIPRDLCISSRLSDQSVWGQMVKLWAPWLVKRDFILDWVALFRVLISSLCFICPALLPQHPYTCCDCWLTCLSLPSITGGQEPSPSHLYVPGAEHSDQRGEWASPWAPERFF